MWECVCVCVEGKKVEGKGGGEMRGWGGEGGREGCIKGKGMCGAGMCVEGRVWWYVCRRQHKACVGRGWKPGEGVCRGRQTAFSVCHCLLLKNPHPPNHKQGWRGGEGGTGEAKREREGMKESKKEEGKKLPRPKVKC